MNSKAEETVHCSKIALNKWGKNAKYILVYKCTYKRYIQNQLILMYAWKGE